MSNTENYHPHSKEESLRLGIKMAQQELFKRGGPEPEETVAHPSDRLTYLFKKTVGEIAFVYLPAEVTSDGQEIEKQFPVDELFNPNDVLLFALLDYTDSHQKPLLN